MTIRQWKVFRAVVEQGSVTRAAQILYMSQPAVSHVVSEMERPSLQGQRMRYAAVP